MNDQDIERVTQAIADELGVEYDDLAPDWSTFKKHKNARHQMYASGFNLTQRDIRDAAQAAIDAMSDSREANQWQPIETAPKDGTIILINSFIGNDLSLAKWARLKSYSGWYLCADGCIVVEEGGGSVDYQQADAPTHWQPLPAPPQEDTP